MAISFINHIINFVFHFDYPKAKEHQSLSSFAAIHQIAQKVGIRSIRTSFLMLQACFGDFTFQTRSFLVEIHLGFGA